MDIQLFLDMDGVVADFCQAMYDAHGVDDPFLDEKIKRGCDSWNIGTIMGLSGQEFWSKECFDFWAKMKTTSDFDDIKNTIHRIVGLNNVTILTTPTDHCDCIGGKEKWLSHYLPEVGNRILFTQRKDTCASPFHILVDDNDTNVNNFRYAGGIAILYPRPWNSRHADMGLYPAAFYLELNLAKKLAAFRVKGYVDAINALGEYANSVTISTA